MAETLGTIRGQMILDVQHALKAYTAVRQANISTVTALHTGAGALTMMGAGMAAAGIGLGAGILTAVGAAAEFEKKLDYFSAVSNSTQAEYDALREKALQLGADTEYSANQIADSFVELAKSGVGAQDIINGIGEAVASLGSAADLPLDTAANIIMSAVQTFGLSADSALMVADKLAGAANASIVSVEDLGTSMKYAGGTASALGIPFEDLNTAVALLGKYGIRGSTAGTSLRTMMLSLGGATPKATTALKELGIITEDGANAFYTAEGSAKPLAEIFQILQDATAGLTDKQKVQALETIFQNRALASAIGLTTEGAAGFTKMAEAIDKTTAAEVAGKRLDNLAGDIEVLQGNIDTMLINSGGAFQGFARELVQGITDLIGAFTALPDGMQTTLMVIASVASVLLIVIGVMGLFAGGIMNMIALGIQLAPVFAALKAGIMIVIGAIRALGVAIMANPLGLIIGIIALVVGALIWFFTQTELGQQVWAEFTRFLGEAWANISRFAIDTFNNLASFFSNLWTNITNFFNTAIAAIMHVFFTFNPIGIIISNWGAIVNFFVTLWTNITTGISNFVTGAITFFQQLPDRVLAFFVALPGMVGYALGFLLGTIARIILEVGTWLITNVPIIINNVVTFFAELPGKVIAFFIELYVTVMSWWSQLSLNILLGAISIVTGIIGWFQQLPAMVGKFFSDVYNNAIRWMAQMIVNVITTAMGIYNGIRNWIMQLPAMILMFFSQVVSNVRSTFTNAVNTAREIAVNIFNTIKEWLSKIPETVKGIFNKVVDTIKGVIGSAVRAVTDFASGLWEGFKDGLGIHSPSYIEHAMWAITGVIDEETQHMKKQVRTLQYLGNGISEIGNNLGYGFGDTMSASMDDLYRQVAAAKNFEAELTARTTMQGVDPQALALEKLDKTLAGMKVETNYDIVVNNPEPEPTSDSIPKSIRKAVYVNG